MAWVDRFAIKVRGWRAKFIRGNFGSYWPLMGVALGLFLYFGYYFIYFSMYAITIPLIRQIFALLASLLLTLYRRVLGLSVPRIQWPQSDVRFPNPIPAPGDEPLPNIDEKPEPPDYSYWFKPEPVKKPIPKGPDPNPWEKSVEYTRLGEDQPRDSKAGEPEVPKVPETLTGRMKNTLAEAKRMLETAKETLAKDVDKLVQAKLTLEVEEETLDTYQQLLDDTTLDTIALKNALLNDSNRTNQTCQANKTHSAVNTTALDLAQHSRWHAQPVFGPVVVGALLSLALGIVIHQYFFAKRARRVSSGNASTNRIK
eukprot:1008515-Pyramimonas_sp.AAC.1